MKRLANTCVVLCLAICLAWILPPTAAISQTATGPEQDCFGALPINRTVITQQLPYSGVGANRNEVSTGLGCVTTAKTNSSWYRLDVGSDGFLAFRLTASNVNDDYNFVVFRFPANASTQAAGCITAVSSASNIVACNFAPGGTTGLDNTLAAQFGSFGQALAVKRGETYMIYISNRTGSGGFTMDFSSSTAGVIPTTLTFPVATASLKANQTMSCGAVSSLALTFSEPILRGSVQPGTFILRGPNNQELTINSIACANCPTLDSNTRKGVSYTLNFTPAISISGTYTLSLSTTVGSIALRNVDNSLIAMPAATIVVNVGSNQPSITSSRPIANNMTTFCLGQSVTLTTDDAGAGTQYQWQREGLNGAIFPVTKGTSRQLDVTGSYAFTETPSTDSSSVLIVTRTVNFRVRVTDGNGCVRTSNPIAVNVSPGLQAKILNAPPQNEDLRPCRNEGVTLVAEAGFRGYLWYKNSQPVDTATARTFLVNDGGNYSVETIDINNCRNMSASFTLTPRDVVVPIIRGDMINCVNPATKKADKTITLSVTPEPSYSKYQWFDNATKRAISGATGNTIAITTGTFYLEVISGNECRVTSGTFTVRAGAAPDDPKISGLSEGQTIPLCPGATHTLTGPPGFKTYQWYFNNTPITGAISRVYIADKPGNYAVQVFTDEGCASALSMPPVVLIGGAVLPTSVTSTSGSLTTCRGVPLDISVTIPDSLLSRSTIEWLRVGQSGVIGTAKTLTVTQAGDYQVKVQFTSSIACPVTTTVTVKVVDNPTPTFAGNTPRTFCQGKTATLRISERFATHQWSRVTGGVSTPIAGATTDSLVVSAAGTYTVTATAVGGCSGTSVPFEVTAVAPPASPVIRSRNGSLELCPNGALELFVENADQTLRYQWSRNGLALAGETRSSLAVTVIGSYSVEATSPNGCTASPNAPSVVTPATLPTAPTFPSQITICPNGDTTLIAPTGFTSYQWLSGVGASAQAIMGETNRQFRITRGGVYSLRVQNILTCFGTSNSITVTQTAVTVQIQTIDAGVRFRATSTPRALLYQWLLNGTNIPGSTDSLFAPQVDGLYSVRVTDVNRCEQTSSTERFTPPKIKLPICTTANCGTSTPSVPPTVRGDSALAAPGDTVIFSITLPSLGTLQAGAKIDATVCFNATLLEPLPPLAAGTISGGVRCIPLTLTIPTDPAASLFNLPFRAALGNDSITALVINARLSPGGAALPATASYFRLTTISYAGGARLIGPAPRMRLTPSRPNPVSDDGIISYVIENAVANERTVETVSVTMSDVYGRIVKTLPITQLIGKEGEIPFNTADLARGVYFVTVRSRGMMQVQKIHVVR